MLLRRAVWPVALAWLSISTSRAGAPADLAESLYRDGKKQFDAGHYDEACPKLAESQRLDPAGGTALLLGLCFEAEGRYASAVTAFTDAVSLAKRDRRADREKVGAERLKVMTKKVARVVVHLSAAVLADNPSVRMGDGDLALVSLDTELFVDPGTVRVSVRAPGYREAVGTAEARSGEVVRIEIATLVPEPPIAASSSPPPPITPPAAPPPAPRGHGIAYGLLSVGAIVTGVGVYFGLQSWSDTRTVKSRCPSSTCSDRDAVSLSQHANREANVANVMIPLGVVAAAVGAVLLFSGSDPAAPSASVAMDHGGVRATVRGSF